MIRVWHPYAAWDDWRAGMWRSVSGKERAWHLRRAIIFTGDAELYGSFMRRVTAEWGTACEHHLSDGGSNRRAWLGHAATCLALGCPEDVTRAAWGYLTKQQQDDANAQAQAAIEDWERAHEGQDSAVHHEMGGPGLSARHTG